MARVAGDLFATARPRPRAVDVQRIGTNLLGAAAPGWNKATVANLQPEDIRGTARGPDGEVLYGPKSLLNFAAHMGLAYA